MPQPPARLWLVRHGQTDWNAAGRMQGHTPTHLNAEGRAQSFALGKLLAHRPFAAIWSSDLPRRLQTAELIAEAAALATPIHPTPELRERSFAQYEGATSHEIQTARAALGLPSTGDLADWTGIPGIESNASLWHRVESFLQKLSAQHPAQDILIITHGGVIARAIFETLRIPDATPRRFPLSNGIVAILELRPDGWYLLSLIDMPLVMTPHTATPIDTSQVREK